MKLKDTCAECIKIKKTAAFRILAITHLVVPILRLPSTAVYLTFESFYSDILFIT